MIRTDPHAGEVIVLALPHRLFDGRGREIRVSHRRRHDGSPYAATIALWDCPEYGDPVSLGYIRLNASEAPAILDALAPLAE